nr:relaxin-like peptide 2 [Patiria pectinifera]
MASQCRLILASISAVCLVIPSLMCLPAVQATEMTNRHCGAAFPDFVLAACSMAKRSIRSSPSLHDLLQAFKSDEYQANRYTSPIHLRKREEYMTIADYCCSVGCAPSDLVASGIC